MDYLFPQVGGKNKKYLKPPPSNSLPLKIGQLTQKG